MYAAKHRNDEAYIPDRVKPRQTVNAVTSETNTTPVASPARAMHAMLDDRFNIDLGRSHSVERFRPLVSFAIIVGFCLAAWSVIAGILFSFLW